jgi:hypothetical protein
MRVSYEGTHVVIELQGEEDDPAAGAALRCLNRYQHGYIEDSLS